MRKMLKYSLIALMGLTAAEAGVTVNDGVAIYTADAQAKAQSSVDFSEAIPMKKTLPAALMDADALTSSFRDQGSKALPKGSAEAGKMGSGNTKLQTTVPLTRVRPDIEVQEYGDAVDGITIPYTTSRVDMYLNINKTAFSKKYPYRAAGQLFFKENGSSYICSASMIKRGVLVTAGHCVVDNSTGNFYNSFQYIPSRKKKSAPYGIWEGAKVYVLNSYRYNQSGECINGVICKNDVAVIVLKPKDGKYAGDYTGWFGYGINTYSYAKVQGLLGAQITQLGYPASHDQATMMQRTDSLGIKAGSDYKNNTVIGSRMTGGSSGGPWLVNFGQVAKLSSGTTRGHEAKTNVIVGVTSWGFTSDQYKIQGASQFTKGNIKKLVNAACKDEPDACRR